MNQEINSMMTIKLNEKISQRDQELVEKQLEMKALKKQLENYNKSRKSYYEKNKEIVKEKAKERLKKLSEENPEKIKISKLLFYFSKAHVRVVYCLMLP